MLWQLSQGEVEERCAVDEVSGSRARVLVHRVLLRGVESRAWQRGGPPGMRCVSWAPEARGSPGPPSPFAPLSG